MSGYHRTLSPQRWAAYDLPTQILMVANEVHRACNCLRCGDAAGAREAYARALELVDLTVAVRPRERLVRELLRWRMLAAEQYLRPAPGLEEGLALLKALLLFTGPSARQIPHLL